MKLTDIHVGDILYQTTHVLCNESPYVKITKIKNNNKIWHKHLNRDKGYKCFAYPSSFRELTTQEMKEVYKHIKFPSWKEEMKQ